MNVVVLAPAVTVKNCRVAVKYGVFDVVLMARKETRIPKGTVGEYELGRQRPRRTVVAREPLNDSELTVSGVLPQAKVVVEYPVQTQELVGTASTFVAIGGVTGVVDKDQVAVLTGGADIKLG